MKPKLLFNGHTWIIVLTGIISLFLLGIVEEVVLYFLASQTSSETINLLERGGMCTVPLQVIYGIVRIIKLTVTGKDDQQPQSLIEEQEK